MDIAIHFQKRKSLALQLSPTGLTALLPYGVDPKSAPVQAFLAQAVANLPAQGPVADPAAPDTIHHLVAQWSIKLGVTVARTQIRRMRTKWGSISTAGILTLSGDLLNLPLALVEYIVVHELLHLKFPDHRRGWRVSMGMYLPDWQERARMLSGYVIGAANLPQT